MAFAAHPTNGVTVGSAEQLIVGFNGPIDTSLLKLAGGDIVRTIAELRLAVVVTWDPLGFTQLVAASPLVAFIETDDLLVSAGSTWDGSTWDGSTWDGSTWDGSAWDGSTWDGSTWDGSTWDGSTWDGSTWDGSTWDGSTWDGSTWDGSTWDGSTWDGSTWDGDAADDEEDDGADNPRDKKGKGAGKSGKDAKPGKGGGDSGWGAEDPFYRDSWGLGAVNAPDAWGRTLGESRVRLCVLDTGIDTTHPDLTPNLLQNRKGHVRAFSAMLHNDDPGDEVGHGSHVAGIAAAATGNARGGSGLAQVTIISVKVMDEYGGTESDLAAGLQMCWQHGARVATLSLHVTEESPALERAVAAAEQHGLLLVAAAGNAGVAAIPYPAAFATVLAVGAVDPSAARAGFSNHGAGLDLVAPGVRIVSTFRDGGYAVGSGTSQAVPFVAGAAALALSADPRLSPHDLRARLVDTARDLGAPGWDEDFGHGAADAGALLDGLGGKKGKRGR